MKRFLYFFILFPVLVFSKAVIFDFGGVIGEVNVYRLIHAIETMEGITGEERMELIYALRHYRFMGISRKECLERALKRVFGEEGNGLFDELLPSLIRYVDGMPELLDELRAEGVQLGILSNVKKKYADHLQNLGFYEGFTPLLLSCDIGYEKPAKEAYEILKEHVKDERIIFVDDKIRNIYASEKCGIPGIRFHSAKQLRKELISRGFIGSSVPAESLSNEKESESSELEVNSGI